jgi:HAD superfamily hydrolase (TIGR01458 family)
LADAAVQAVVLDMEGVLHVDYEPLEGAPEAVARLRSAGLELAILTNTTGRTRASIAQRLEEMGMSFPAERIVTAAHATALHVRSAHPGAAVYLLGEQGAAPEFDGVRLVEDPAEADVVVVAGPSREVDYPLLNRAFRALVDGRPLVAMQRNRWWPTTRGPAMDAGGLVAALEYSAEVRADVVGKPCETIYRIALETMDASPDEAVMVGDDLISDLRPAAAIGMRTGLVRTGKGASMTPEPGELTYDEPDLARIADRLLS